MGACLKNAHNRATCSVETETSTTLRHNRGRCAKRSTISGGLTTGVHTQTMMNVSCGCGCLLLEWCQTLDCYRPSIVVIDEGRAATPVRPTWMNPCVINSSPPNASISHALDGPATIVNANGESQRAPTQNSCFTQQAPPPPPWVPNSLLTLLLPELLARLSCPCDLVCPC